MELAEAVLFEVFGSVAVGPIAAVFVTTVPGAVPAVTVITNVNVAEVFAAIDAGPLQVNDPPDGGLQVQPVGSGVAVVTVSYVENVSVRTGFATAAGPLFVTTTV